VSNFLSNWCIIVVMGVSQFSVVLPTKPFLKKYIETDYGSPAQFDSSDYYGMMIALALEKDVYHNKEWSFIHKAFDKFTVQLQILLPVRWFNEYQYGTGINQKNAVFLNKLLEKKFEDEFANFAFCYKMLGLERKNAIEDFCKRYNIELEYDINYDAMVKKHQRYEEKSAKKFAPDLSAKPLPPLPLRLF